MEGRGGPLAIGVGNADRGDDGAGIEVARLLAAAGVPCIVHEGDGLGLIEAWDGFALVVVIDAVVIDAVWGGPKPGDFARFDATAEPLPRYLGGSAHGIGLAQTIEIARALSRLPRSLVVYAIGASSFTLGDGPAAPVARACAAVADRIVAEMRLFRDAV